MEKSSFRGATSPFVARASASRSCSVLRRRFSHRRARPSRPSQCFLANASYTSISARTNARSSSGSTPCPTKCASAIISSSRSRRFSSARRGGEVPLAVRFPSPNRRSTSGTSDAPRTPSPPTNGPHANGPALRSKKEARGGRRARRRGTFLVVVAVGAGRRHCLRRDAEALRRARRSETSNATVRRCAAGVVAREGRRRP